MILTTLTIGALAVAPTVRQAADTQPLPTSPAQITTPVLRAWTPPAPERHELPHGGLLLALGDTSLPLVDGLLTFRGGSLDEPADRAGLTSMLADALREGGSNAYPGPELDAWLDQHAASISLGTSEDRITIEFHCLAEDADAVLERAFSLITDPAYPAPVVERSRSRALAGVARLADDTGALADATLDRVVYGWDTPWGRQATATSVNAVTAADLASFHRAHLGPDRLVAGVTGDVDGAHVAERIAALWGETAALGPAPPVPPARFLVPPTSRVYLVDRPGVTQTELRIASPGTTRLDPDYAALYLWSNVIGIGGMTNRMMQRVRTDLGLAYGVGGFYRPGWDQPGYFYGFCGTANETAAQALEEMTEVILEGGGKPVPPAEVSTVRDRVRAADVFRVDTSWKVLSRAVDLAFHDYPQDFYTQVDEALVKLDAYSLVQAVRKRYALHQQVFVAVGPADELEASLTRIAPVHRIALEPGRPTSSPEGEALAAEVLTALGGAEAWAAAETLALATRFTLTAGGGQLVVETEQWRDLSRVLMRVEQAQRGRNFVTTLDGGDGWSYDGVALRALNPTERADHVLRERRSLYRVLHQLGRGGELGVQAEERRLVVSDDLGPLLWLDVGEDGLPTRSGGDDSGTQEIVYAEWSESETGGLRYASRFEIPLRKAEVEVTSFTPGVELDPRLFTSRERP